MLLPIAYITVAIIFWIGVSILGAYASESVWVVAPASLIVGVFWPVVLAILLVFGIASLPYWLAKRLI
jgi:ABC-type proline/glycine betaine transport system permease subunit